MTDLIPFDEKQKIAMSYLSALSIDPEELVKNARSQAFIDQQFILASGSFDYPDFDDPKSMAYRQTQEYINIMSTFIKVGYQIPAFANSGKLIQEAVKEFAKDPDSANLKLDFAKKVADATKSINDVTSKMNMPVVNVNVDRREYSDSEKRDRIKARFNV